MKSAKDKLAHYRKQGFGDELIELLVMEEDDQVFAEEMLDALIVELEEKDAINETAESMSLEINEDIEVPEGIFEEEITQEAEVLQVEEEVQESIDFTEKNDSELSAEMIESAYKRDNVEFDDDKEDEMDFEDDNEYIPPVLELLEGGYEEPEGIIIPFLPEYALSEVEREFVQVRAEFLYGNEELEDELAPLREANEIDEFECLDFDDTSAPAEKEWFYDEVEVAQIEEVDDDFIEVEAVEIAAVEAEDVTLIDLENSQAAEDEWQEAVNRPHRELAEITKLVETAGNKITEQQKMTVSLQDELNNRDETILMQGSEMNRLKDLRASMEAELVSESQKFAETVNMLNNYREEKDRTEQELLLFGNEIELLHGQLFNANDALSKQIGVTADKEEIITALDANNNILRKQNHNLKDEVGSLLQSHEKELTAKQAELTALQGVISDLDNEVAGLTKDLETSGRYALDQQDKYEAELASLKHNTQLLNRELEQLKGEKANLEVSLNEQSAGIINKNSVIDSLSNRLDKELAESLEHQEQFGELTAASEKQARRIKRLEALRRKMKRLEFENNVLNTETVPNLQQDKEDLVELASEEYNKAQSLDELVAKRGRRASYTTTLAAAACLMLVLMPVLSWNNIETQKNDIKSDYAMQVAAVEADNVMLQEERDVLRGQLENVNDEFESARQSWSIKLSALQQENARQANRGEVLQASMEYPVDEFDSEAILDGLGEDEFAAVGMEDGQYNEVQGIAEYQAAVVASSMELLDGKQAHVRSGEGLSQVLWRVYRTSSPEMVAYITKLNNLPKDRRGQPKLKVNQKLKLPQDVNTAMADSANGRNTL